MPHVIYSKPATRDIARIGKHIRKHNPLVSKSFIESMKEKCRALSSAPLIGQEREGYGHGVRSFPFGKYVIFYLPENFGVTIVRVIHGMRDLPTAFSSDD